MKQHLIVLMIPFGLLAQSANNPQVTLRTPPPPLMGANQITTTIVGGTGTTQRYFWVVVNYPIGSPGVSGPLFINNQPATLSVSNYVTLSWPCQSGATSYDVLKTLPGEATPLPGNTYTYALTTGLTACTYNDIGTGRTSYTVPNPIPTAVSSMILDNQDSAVPFFYFTAPVTLPTGSITTLEACVGTPGNTIGVLNQLCIDSNSSLWVCTVSSCTLAAQWVEASASSVSLLGTTNEICLTTVSGVTTIAACNPFNAPGTITGTTITAGTTGTAGCIHFYDTAGTDTPLCSPNTSNNDLYINGTIILKSGGDVTSTGGAAPVVISVGAGALLTSTAGVIYPLADSTTAIQFDKANGTSNVMTIDTTNGRVGIGTVAPANGLDVEAAAKFGSTIISSKAADSTQSGTSGTATCFQPFQGTAYKYGLCTLSGYAETGTAQTWTYPTAYTTLPVILANSGSVAGQCGAINSQSTTTTVLTLPANAAMTAQTCVIIIEGR